MTPPHRSDKILVPPSRIGPNLLGRMLQPRGFSVVEFPELFAVQPLDLPRLDRAATAPPREGWILFSGLVSVALAIMIFVKWPASGLWFIGLVIAIEMISHGWAYVAISMAAKAARGAATEALKQTDSAAPA